ncbi:MAG: polyprenyl synthetase family protein [Selenomonadaceae bacterium]|nr:polyprenyl synthetase family protein [Selenomonadaceae bacterium]
MFEVIKGDLAKLEERLPQDVSSSVNFVTEIGTHLVTSGGKRIRPALCILAARGGQDFSLERILPLASALELIHTASLVHDDVIDNADTRRGAPTANAKWGNKIAILSGDFIFAQAFRLVAEGSYGDYVGQRLAELVGNLSLGEIIQDKESYQVYSDYDNYYERIAKKTADFLEICCELGAVVGGLSADSCRRLSEYGHNIGMAFQITDDLLDIQQTSEHIGKPVGNDMRQGIVTLPVIRALEVSDDAAELSAILRDRYMTDSMVERALSIVKNSDGEEFAKRKVDEYLDLARDVLPRDLPAEVREAFALVADFIGDRDF